MRAAGWVVVPGRANFVMCRPPPGRAVNDIAASCRARGVFVRVVDDRTMRIAVRDALETETIIRALGVAVGARDPPPNDG